MCHEYISAEKKKRYTGTGSSRTQGRLRLRVLLLQHNVHLKLQTQLEAGQQAEAAVQQKPTPVGRIWPEPLEIDPAYSHLITI